MTALLVGAYAAMPSEVRANARLNLAFQANAVAVANANGLEVPWGSAEFVPDREALESMLVASGEHAVTLLPATMQHPPAGRFGLASTDEEARAAAVAFAEEALHAAKALAQRAGRRVIRSVLIHSAPLTDSAALFAHATAFRRSLDDLLASADGEVEILVEHCDSATGAHRAKAFLPIDVELDALEERRGSAGTLGMYINWGRSVLDTGRADGAVEQARLAGERGLLRGLGVSGVSSGDTSLGPAWSDAHLPVLTDHDPSSPLASTLLTAERLDAFLALLPSAAFTLLKVAAPPGSDPLETIRASANAVHHHLASTGK